MNDVVVAYIGVGIFKFVDKCCFGIDPCFIETEYIIVRY